MSTLTDSGDRLSEWSLFEDLYVTIFAFYAIIKVSVNVLHRRLLLATDDTQINAFTGLLHTTYTS